MKDHHLYPVSLFLSLSFIFLIRGETGNEGGNKSKIQSPAPGGTVVLPLIFSSPIHF